MWWPSQPRKKSVGLCRTGPSTSVHVVCPKLTLYQVLGVAHLHKHGIIHCDLKPSNVLVDGAGHVRICDFGSARIVPPSPECKYQVVNHRGLRGTTPLFVPPEVEAKGDSFDESVDIWALATIFCAFYLTPVSKHPCIALVS